MKRSIGKKRIRKSTMKSDKELFEEHLNEISSIILSAIDYYEYSNYLRNPDTEKERNFIHYNTHISFIQNTIEITLVLELSKLFSNSPNDEFSIFNLIEYLKRNGEFESLEYDNNLLNDWSDILVSKKEIIEIVKTLRDKFYAHTDQFRFYNKNFLRMFDYPYKPYFEELFSLIDLAIVIVRKLSLDITKEEIHFFRRHFRRNDFQEIIITLADSEKVNKKSIL